MGSRRIEVQIVGDAGSLERAFRSAGSSASRFGGTMATLGKTAALAAGAAGLGAIALTLKRGYSEWVDSTRVAAQTAAVLKSTGGIANVTAKQIDELASSLLKKTGIDDETIKSGENLLLTFTNIRNEVGAGNDVFTRATKAITDMSVALGQDMKSSAIQVGKALNDPITGLTALRRVGVSFTEAQRDQIKALVQSGDTLRAQRVILAELNKEFGGSAEAVGRTLPGQLSILRESFNNFAGDLVSRAAPAVAGFLRQIQSADGFKAKLNVVWDDLSGLARRLIDGLQEKLKTADWTKVGEKVGAGIGGALKFSAKLAADLTRELKLAVENINWHSVAEGFGIGLAKSIAGLDKTSAKILIEEFGHGDASRALRRTMESGIADELRKLKLPKAELAAAMAELGKISNESLLKSIQRGDTHEIALVIAAKVQAAAAQAQGAAASGGASVGHALSQGIAAGIFAEGGAIQAAAQRVVAATIAAARAAARAQSPSLETKEKIGKPLAEGVIVGWIEGSAPLPGKMSETLRNAIEHGRQVVDDARSRFSSVWSRFADDALAAFDRITAAYQTPAEKVLAQLDKKETYDRLNKALADAQAQLQQALAGGDPQAIADATAAVNQAELDIQRQFLEERAAKERQAYEDRRELRRRHFADALDDLGQHMAKQGETWKQAHAAIIALLHKFGIDYKKAGRGLGVAFIEGLKEALDAAAGASAEIGGLIARVSAGIAIPKLAAGGTVLQTGLAVVHRGETFSGIGAARRGGEGQSLIVNFHGAVWDKEAAVRDIANEISRLRRDSGLPPLLGV
jgi:hypothetical protein